MSFEPPEKTPLSLEDHRSALSLARAGSPSSDLGLFLWSHGPPQTHSVLLNNIGTSKSNTKLIKRMSLRVGLWPKCQYISGKERKLKLTSACLIWVTSAAWQRRPGGKAVFSVNSRKPLGSNQISILYSCFIWKVTMLLGLGSLMA